MKILAVDDDPVFLELLGDVLKPAGLPDIVTAESGDAALEIIADHPHGFDCFLLDISMPGKDGISLCREIRKIKRHKETPILMITASSDVGDVDRAFAAGATDYISKPLQSLELGSRIRVAMMLHDQVRRLAKAAILANDRIGLTDQEAINCFEGELAVRQVAAIRDLQRLENDLLRLPQGNYNLSVFAIKVADADELFAEFGAEDFRNIMSQVARSISTKLDLSRSNYAYAGKGIFGATLFGRDVRAEMNRLRTSFGQALQIWVRPGDIRTIKLKTVLAESNVRHIRSGCSAADALESAINRADSRASDLKLQERLDTHRLDMPVKPRRHRINFKRF